MYVTISRKWAKSNAYTIETSWSPLSERSRDLHWPYVVFLNFSVESTITWLVGHQSRITLSFLNSGPSLYNAHKTATVGSDTKNLLCALINAKIHDPRYVSANFKREEEKYTFLSNEKLIVLLLFLYRLSPKAITQDKGVRSWFVLHCTLISNLM